MDKNKDKGVSGMNLYAKGIASCMSQIETLKTER